MTSSFESVTLSIHSVPARTDEDYSFCYQEPLLTEKVPGAIRDLDRLMRVIGGAARFVRFRSADLRRARERRT